LARVRSKDYKLKTAVLIVSLSLLKAPRRIHREYSDEDTRMRRSRP
jgi:hypothetical protein